MKFDIHPHILLPLHLQASHANAKSQKKREIRLVLFVSLYLQSIQMQGLKTIGDQIIRIYSSKVLRCSNPNAQVKKIEIRLDLPIPQKILKPSNSNAQSKKK